MGLRPQKTDSIIPTTTTQQTCQLISLMPRVPAKLFICPLTIEHYNNARLTCCTKDPILSINAGTAKWFALYVHKSIKISHQIIRINLNEVWNSTNMVVNNVNPPFFINTFVICQIAEGVYLG